MDLEGKVLEVGWSVGAREAIALGKHNVALINQFLPPYGELVRRGLVFSVTDGAGTGNAPGTTIGTACAFNIYNPVGSGKNAILLGCRVVYVSGTLGTGNLFFVGQAATAEPTSGTSLTPYNCLQGDTSSGVVKAKRGATLAATPNVLDLCCQLPPILATSVVAPWIVDHDLRGRFVCGPGSVLGLEAIAAAGTSPILNYAFTWAEVPV